MVCIINYGDLIKNLERGGGGGVVGERGWFECTKDWETFMADYLASIIFFWSGQLAYRQPLWTSGLQMCISMVG